MFRLCSASVSQLMKSWREFWKSVARARASSSFACRSGEGEKEGEKTKPQDGGLGLRIRGSADRGGLCVAAETSLEQEPHQPGNAACFPRGGGSGESHRLLSKQESTLEGGNSMGMQQLPCHPQHDIAVGERLGEQGGGYFDGTSCSAANLSWAEATASLVLSHHRPKALDGVSSEDLARWLAGDQQRLPFRAAGCFFPPLL